MPSTVRSRAEWIEICEDFKRSAMTPADYARLHGLHPSTLRKWRSKLVQAQRASSLGALQLGHQAGTLSGFVEVIATHRPLSSSTEIVVHFGNVQISCGEQWPPAAWIAELAAQC
jgi:transposase-like protein